MGRRMTGKVAKHDGSFCGVVVDFSVSFRAFRGSGFPGSTGSEGRKTPSS